MTVEITRLDLMGLTYVCRNLRESDRREIYATMWDEDPDALAIKHKNVGEFAYIAWFNGTPAAVIGANPMWPRVWSVWAFGTDDFGKVALSLTKHARRVMMPALYKRGFHRAEAYSIEGHDKSHRWLISLGARAERRVPKYGKNGEEFIVFSWDREAVERLGATGDRRPETEGERQFEAAGD